MLHSQPSQNRKSTVVLLLKGKVEKVLVFKKRGYLQIILSAYKKEIYQILNIPGLCNDSSIAINVSSQTNPSGTLFL